MASIPISEAKARLASLVREVAQSGEAYVISVNGKPMAELRPFVAVPTPGRFRKEISFDEDAFTPLDDDEASLWGV